MADFKFTVPGPPLPEQNNLMLQMKAAMMRAQGEFRPSGRLREKFPLSELWIVVTAHANQRYDLVASDGIRTLQDVMCIVPQFTKVLIPPGSTVVVRYTEKRVPFIKFVAPTYTKKYVKPAPPDIPVDPPVFTAGLWLQQMGYWWFPGHSLDPQARFSVTPPEQASYSNESMACWLQDNGGGDIQTILTWRNPIQVFGSPWSIKKDGTLLVDRPTGFLPPTIEGYEVYFSGFTISESFDPSGGQLPPGTYTALSIHGVDWSSSAFTSSYKGNYTGKTTSALSTGEDGNGVLSSMAFKGLMLFPENGHQIISTYTPHLEVEGMNYQTFFAINPITMVLPGDEDSWNYQLEGNTFFLSNPPIDADNVTGLSWSTLLGSSEIDYYDRDVILIESNLLGVRLRLLGSRHPHFYFSYKDHEENLIDSKVSNGSSQTLAVMDKVLEYINILGTDMEIPGYLITGINSVQVNGLDDLGATFYRDELTLSIPLSAGDVVSFDLEGWVLGNDDQMFLTSFGQNRFTLDNNVPGPGRIVWVNYLNQGDTGEDTGDPFNFNRYCRVVGGTNDVEIYRFFSAGETITVEFNYKQAIGNYYKTQELRVYEVGGVEGLRILKTPIPETTLNPPDLPDPFAAYSPDRLVSENLGYFREGMAFFEPNTMSYTLVGPSGIVWRSRALLTDPAPTIADPPAHFTHTPWPAEDIAQDWFNTNPYYVTPPVELVKNREHPWFNFSCAGPFGMQGSWNRYGGVLGDSTQKLRLWKRHGVTFEWSNHQNLDLTKLLPPDRDTSHPARIQGMGRTDLYNRIASNSGEDGGNRFPGRWPMEKNYRAWIVAAPWVVENFQSDLDNYNANRNKMDIGWKDVGLTFNAIHPVSGDVLAQYTIKPSKDPEDAIQTFSDNMEQLNYFKEQNNASLLESIDKYYNHNPIYYPGGDPLPPWDGQNTVIASGNFATVPWDSGNIFRLYQRITGYNSPQSRNLFYPGIPSFPSMPSNPQINFSFPDAGQSQWLFSAYSSPDSDISLNRALQPNLGMDASGNMYFCLYMPVWKQYQDINPPTPFSTEGFVKRSKTFFFEAVENNTGSMIRVCDFDGNLCDGHVEVKLNGSPWSGHEYPGNFTGHLIPYTYEFVFVPGTFLRYDGATEEFIGYPVYLIPDVTIEVSWYQPDVSAYGELLQPAGAFEYPTFIGFQATPMPVRGMAIANGPSDRTQNYQSRAIPWLFKLHYDAESHTFTERWRKNIGQMINHRAGEFNSGEYTPDVNPLSEVGNLVPNFTLACGRYIFVVKDIVCMEPEGTTFSDFYKKKSVLEVYHNQDSEPDIFKSLDIPNTSDTSGNPYNWNWTLSASCDVDSTGREHLFLKLKSGHGVSFLFPAVEGADPDIQSQAWAATEGEPNFPETGYDAQSLARAVDQAYWVDSGGTVKKKSLG